MTLGSRGRKREDPGNEVGRVHPFSQQNCDISCKKRNLSCIKGEIFLNLATELHHESFSKNLCYKIFVVAAIVAKSQ